MLAAPALVCSLLLQAASSRNVERQIEVSLVEVPVQVTGAGGVPLRDLHAEDFELTVDGRRVEITGFDAVDLDAPPKSGPDGTVAQPPPAARRHFVLLFDLSFSRPTRVARARSAARDFVAKGLRPTDLAAVVTQDSERGLKLVVTFTSDRAQLLRAVDSLGLGAQHEGRAPDPLGLYVSPLPAGAPRGGEEGAGGIGDEEMAEMLNRLNTSARQHGDDQQRGRVAAAMGSFESLAATLGSVKGRKEVVYFSEGFDARLLAGEVEENAGRATADAVVSGEIWKVDSSQRFGRSDLQSRMEALFAAFNRADCAVHAVDLGGLGDTGPSGAVTTRGEAVREQLDAGPRRGRDALFQLSKGTGGVLFENSNDMSAHLARLQAQTAFSYLLTFSSPTAEPGRYHAIKVSVKRSGTRVSARPGFHEPRPFSSLSPAEKRIATAQLVTGGLPRAELAARVLVAPFRTRKPDLFDVPVVVDLDGPPLLVNHAGPTLPLEVFVYAMNEELAAVDYFAESVTLDLAKAEPALRASGVKACGMLRLPPGRYGLRVLARNGETGRSSLSIIPLTVPRWGRQPVVLPPLVHEPSGARISALAPPRDGQAADAAFVAAGQAYLPAAAPRLTAGAGARVTLVTYGFSSAAPPGAEARLVGASGETPVPVRVEGQERAPDGSRRLELAATLPDVAPGVYRLVAKVTTEGQTAEAELPLEIAAR